ncbi:MAG: TlpA family protein disulfide reductase [Bacilli bacterium]
MKKELLVISAVWCPSCLILNKHLKKLKEEYSNLIISRLDYDMDEDKIFKYNIGDKLPVMILLDEEGNELKRLIGEKSYNEIVDFLEV